MAPSPDDFPRTSAPVPSPRARDRGLRRGRRLTRWITVTSVAGAAALGGFYTHLLPAAPAPSGPSAPNPAASFTTAEADDDEEHGEWNGHDNEDDEGAAHVTRQTPQPQPPPPPQPPTTTKQQPHTTTGAS